MKYIINHSRFKKKFNENELILFVDKKNRIKRFPIYSKNYFNFFNNYAKKNYKLIENNCLCGSQDDILLSETDRHCVEFITVVCKGCGLIRAKKYFRNEDVVDFYENFYRTKHYLKKFEDHKPENIFHDQKVSSKYIFDLLYKFKNQELKNLKIVDLGGGSGGVLDHFDKNNQRFLFDFFDSYLDYAKQKV